MYDIFTLLNSGLDVSRALEGDGVLHDGYNIKENMKTVEREWRKTNYPPKYEYS